VGVPSIVHIPFQSSSSTYINESLQLCNCTSVSNLVIATSRDSNWHESYNFMVAICRRGNWYNYRL